MRHKKIHVVYYSATRAFEFSAFSLNANDQNQDSDLIVCSPTRDNAKANDLGHATGLWYKRIGGDIKCKKGRQNATI